MQFEPTAPRTPERARLVIVDDHDLVRAGVRTLLSGERGLELASARLPAGAAVPRG